MPKVFNKEEKLLEPPDLLEAPHDHQEYIDPNTVSTLITWYAPARPFRKRDRSYYTTVAILIVLISLIAILAGERLLIGVLLAIGFVVYVLNFVPPENIENKISTEGITTGGHFYHWDELDSFWISEKEGSRILSVLTHLRFPGMLMLLLDPLQEDEVKNACARFLPFHEIPPKSLLENWAEGLQKHFPLENPHR